MHSNEDEMPGSSPGKYDSDYLEEKQAAVEGLPPGALLPEQHKAYLIERHGTLDLDPIPNHDPADPYNWPSWKVSQPHMDSTPANP